MSSFDLMDEDGLLIGITHIHAETDLVIGVDSNTDHKELGAPNFLSPRELFFKGLFVVGVSFDVVTRYYVKNPADVYKLFQIIKRDSSYCFIGMDPDAAKEIALEVSERK